MANVVNGTKSLPGSIYTTPAVSQNVSQNDEESKEPSVADEFNGEKSVQKLSDALVAQDEADPVQQEQLQIEESLSDKDDGHEGESEQEITVSAQPYSERPPSLQEQHQSGGTSSLGTDP